MTTHAIETRPSRLLGPALTNLQIIARGACPLCGLGLAECLSVARASGRPTAKEGA